MGFTHKGKRLDVNDHDDFNEDISADSDDDKNDRTKRKGFLNEEMVEKLEKIQQDLELNQNEHCLEPSCYHSHFCLHPNPNCGVGATIVC